MTIRHNFYSDTQTRPSRAMLETALEAEVGDEQGGLDPTTAALESRVAELLGMEAAVFLPSGTMCNEIAINVHCQPGDEVICHRHSHIIGYETGGPAAMSGVMVHPLDGANGQFSAAEMAGALRPASRYSPRSRLVSAEQTANLAGGTVWPVAQLEAVAEAARAAGLASHMDGARLLNAAVASVRPAKDHAGTFDSAWIDLTKGLGCAVGAVLAGSREFIQGAWRVKQRIGGGMRQSGVLAAMGLYALDHCVERLADDHKLAAEIASRLAEMPLVAGMCPVETNIIIFDLVEDGPDAEAAAARLLAEGVRVSVFGPRRLRVVTHMDVGPSDAEALIAAFARLTK